MQKKKDEKNNECAKVTGYEPTWSISANIVNGVKVTNSRLRCRALESKHVNSVSVPKMNWLYQHW